MSACVTGYDSARSQDGRGPRSWTGQLPAQGIPSHGPGSRTCPSRARSQPGGCRKRVCRSLRSSTRSCHCQQGSMVRIDRGPPSAHPVLGSLWQIRQTQGVAGRITVGTVAGVSLRQNLHLRKWKRLWLSPMEGCSVL